MRLIDADEFFKDFAELEPYEHISHEYDIDAEPIKHGKWIRILDTRFGEKLNDIIGCSVCNIYFSSMDMIRRSYCPNCGARMDAE